MKLSRRQKILKLESFGPVVPTISPQRKFVHLRDTSPVAIFGSEGWHYEKFLVKVSIGKDIENNHTDQWSFLGSLSFGGLGSSWQYISGI